MKKNSFIMRGTRLHLGALMIGALLFASCADTYDGKDTFSGGVTNATLESPNESEITITPSPDGTQQTITWPVVFGAGGYEVSLYDVNDPTLPVTVDEIENKVIDGCSITASRTEDTNYKLIVRTLGNEKLNNKGAEAPMQKTFSTFAPAFDKINSGKDIFAYFQENPLPELQKEAIIYDLEPNGTYTLSNSVDFGAQNVVFRATGQNALITCENGACFIFGNGIKLQNVNIDNTGNTTNGLFTMSNTPSGDLSTEKLGYIAKGASQNGYVMTNPVYLKNVNVKGLQKSLIYGNSTNWSVENMILEDCLVQLDNDGSMGVINLSGASNGLIKNLSVIGCTFYNLKENSSAYFLRYGNSSNAQPQKIFGTGEQTTLSITNNTFANVFTNKDFANNLANTNLVNIILKDNIFYDVFRVYQFVQTNANRTTTNNYIWWVKTDKQGNDTSRTDSNGNPICTEADPGFPAMEALSPLDFNAPNCGVDFTPSGVPFDNAAGDPRWLPAND